MTTDINTMPILTRRRMASPQLGPADRRQMAVYVWLDASTPHMNLLTQHRAEIYSTNPIERLNRKIKRRSDVVGIFPHEDTVTSCTGACCPAAP
jgi:transposase-like protein